eukprot:COSAG03_NODE_10626_length_638_cov_1.213358_1_plen_66_part_10
MRSVDTDRNHQIDFAEFCFRFGRRYQMEIAAERRRQNPGFPAERPGTGSGGGAQRIAESPSKSWPK